MKVIVNGEEHELLPSDAIVRKLDDRLMVTTPEGTFSAVAVRKGDTTLVSYRGRQYVIERAGRKRAGGAASSGELRAPMPGLIVEVLVQEGQTVAKGDKILILEAMKTQQTFVAPFAGVVSALSVSKGEQVTEGAVMALVKEEGAKTAAGE